MKGKISKRPYKNNVQRQSTHLFKENVSKDITINWRPNEGRKVRIHYRVCPLKEVSSWQGLDVRQVTGTSADCTTWGEAKRREGDGQAGQQIRTTTSCEILCHVYIGRKVRKPLICCMQTMISICILKPEELSILSSRLDNGKLRGSWRRAESHAAFGGLEVSFTDGLSYRGPCAGIKRNERTRVSYSSREEAKQRIYHEREHPIRKWVVYHRLFRADDILTDIITLTMYKWRKCSKTFAEKYICTSWSSPVQLMVTGKELVGPARVFSSDLRIPEDIEDAKFLTRL